MAMVLDELKQLQPQPFPNREFWTGQHFRVFGKNGRGKVQAARLCNRQQKCRSLKAVGLQCCGNQNVCIDYKAQCDHQRFFFSDLAALII